MYKMAIPTCDKLKLPDEIISLVKSYIWHDFTTMKKKYQLLCQLKFKYKFRRCVYRYNTYDDVFIYGLRMIICKKCGNYMKYLQSSSHPLSCACNC